MNSLFELLPLALFFVAYQAKGMLAAVTTLMIATPLTIGALLLLRRRPNPIHYWTCAAVLFFGGLTLISKEPLFIMLKPTVVYCAIALGLAAALLLGKNPLGALFADKLPNIPAHAWQRMAWQWVGALAVLAAANLALAFTLSEAAWVNVRIFGFPILCFAFIAAQFALMLRRHGSAAAVD